MSRRNTTPWTTPDLQTTSIGGHHSAPSFYRHRESTAPQPPSDRPATAQRPPSGSQSRYARLGLPTPTPSRPIQRADFSDISHARPTPRASFSLYRYRNHLFTGDSLSTTRVARRTRTARHHARRPPNVPVITTFTAFSLHSLPPRPESPINPQSGPPPPRTQLASPRLRREVVSY